MIHRFGAALFAAFVLSGAAWAQTPAEDNVRLESARLFRSVMSPYCTGLTLMACPSPQAFELRDEIRERMASGASANEIRAELAARFGQNIIGNPSNSPTGQIFLGLVAALAAVSAVGIGAYTRRAVRQDAAAPQSVNELDAVFEARIDDELADL